MALTNQHSGMIAIVGAPNAGKSTLVNAFVGQKVSIVTPKVQTTRFCVRGVLTEKYHQAVLVDTPGIFEAKKKFEASLVKEAFSGLKGVDATVILVDVSRPVDEEAHALLAQLLKNRTTVALALNKVDKIKKAELLGIVADLAARYGELEIFMISAKTSDGLQDLKRWMFKQLPEHPFLYPKDQVSDAQMKHLAAEITREKLFLIMREELPYNATVVPESWEEKPGAVVIKQAVIVTRENHKKMVIGNKGDTLKRIGASARRELEKMLEKKVHLTLFVKVDEKWQDKTITLGQQYEG